jgi:transcriptional regulator with XRE-family HTH domain
MDTIHARIRSYRLKKGYTLQEVATLTGIPASTYKEWENGRQIRGEPYLILARTFEVSLQELITGQKAQVGSTLERLDAMITEIETLKKELVSFF